MAANFVSSLTRLPFARALLLLPALAGCSSWTTTPRASQQITDFKDTVKSVSGQGDIAGVDPRARQIERNLGVGR